MAWFVSRRNCPSFLTANTVAGPLDSAHRSGRAGGDHQDPPTTLLLYRRTAHPIGPPPHPASATALALGNPVQSRPRSIAIPSISCLTAPLVPTHPPRLPNRFEDSRQVGPRASLAVAALTISPSTRHRGPSTSPLRGYRTLLPAISIGIKPSPSLSLASHPFSDQHGYIPSVDSSLGGEVSATRRRMRRSTGFRIPEGTSQLPRSSWGIPSRRRPPPNPSPSGAPPGHPTSRNRPHSGCFPLHAEASR